MVNNIIYLAAGNSIRFGSNKLLHLIDGRPMFTYGLDILTQIVSENKNYRLFVITQYDEIAEYAGEYAVYSPDSIKGASYSIKAGIRSTKEEGYYTFVAADQPYMNYDTLKHFMEAVINSKCLTGCVTHNGSNGNPVMFSTILKDELMSLGEDEGGRGVLKRHLDNCCKYEVLDEKELQDIDIP